MNSRLIVCRSVCIKLINKRESEDVGGERKEEERNWERRRMGEREMR